MEREKVFKPTTENEGLHQDTNDYAVRIVNLATSLNLFVRSTMFLHRNFHKYSWNSPDGKTHHQIDQVLIDRRWHSSILDVRFSGEMSVILITIWWLQKLGKDLQ